MAITTISGINTALPGQRWLFAKALTTASGNWVSSWNLAGWPGQGANPSSGLGGDVPTSSTTGAPSFVNPASGNTYLARIEGTPSLTSNLAPFVIAVYDRLWHNSGINATIATAQTISSVALTRPDANGARAEAWWEVYAAMGSGTPTVTLAYTDQDGNTETTGSSGALASGMSVGRCGAFQLAAGDTGVRSIQTWTASATFVSGTIGLVIRRMLTMVTFPASFPSAADALAVGLPRVYDSACLEVLVESLSTQTVNGGWSFSLIQG